MKKVIIMVLMLIVMSYGARQWHSSIIVEHVSLGLNEYYASASDGIGRLVITDSNGSAYYFMHSEDPALLELTKIYMSMALSAKNSGNEVKFITESYNNDESIRRIVHMHVGK